MHALYLIVSFEPHQNVGRLVLSVFNLKRVYLDVSVCNLQRMDVMKTLSNIVADVTDLFQLQRSLTEDVGNRTIEEICIDDDLSFCL